MYGPTADNRSNELSTCRVGMIGITSRLMATDTITTYATDCSTLSRTNLTAASAVRREITHVTPRKHHEQHNRRGGRTERQDPNRR